MHFEVRDRGTSFNIKSDHIMSLAGIHIIIVVEKRELTEHDELVSKTSKV